MADDKLTALAEDEPDPFQGLQAVRHMRTEAERLESVMVRRARNNGASWAQIATVLGVSKQAVHKKHGGKGR
jgi:hypothetical protein